MNTVTRVKVIMPRFFRAFSKVIHGEKLQTRLIYSTARCQLRAKNLFKNYALNHHKMKKPMIPLFLQTQNHFDRRAVVDQHGDHLYKDILNSANILADSILEILECDDIILDKERISILCPNDVSYVVAQMATWISGGMAVPLCTSHPTSELQYFIEDSQSSLVLYAEEFEDRMKPLLQHLKVSSLMLKKTDYIAETSQSLVKLGNTMEMKHDKRTVFFKNVIKDNLFKQREALIIYTSGTTGRPKGVVHTHGSLDAQIQGMISAWNWSTNDVLLHVLPLHHVHGLVNALMTPLYIGATCVMLPKFEAQQVWEELTNPTTSKFRQSVSIFMAVPTIYAKLIEFFEHNYQGKSMKISSNNIKAVCSRIRLMVSGSAALPSPIMERWEEITGHKLLERYGMTETGMILTNNIDGPRPAGCVGNPFPEVKVCISKPNTYEEKGYDVICKGTSRSTVIANGMENEQGELLVRGPNMFKCYWNKSEDTQKAYTVDGWFKTGDTAVFRDGVYKILGRTSVDIIKSGGYKISALEIERHLLAHPDIADVVVIGIPDFTWGQRVAAIVVPADSTGGRSISLQNVRDFCIDKLAEYQMPSKLKVLQTMPRNAMGKVNKKELAAEVFANELRML